ncbi:MAG: restriction endonuclease [Deltaproteobacteria bacterium]|nr:restriction endonuclease [Deltaproteobacteria bacterium]
MKVYVKSFDGTWLMPTHAAKARVLVKQNRAKVVQRTPFAIQLTYKATGHIQPSTIGIDDGGVSVGISAVANGKPLYQEEVELRTDIKSKMKIRREYRRGRRYRKTRYRKCRFLNRRHSIPRCKVCGGNAPKSQVICGKCLAAVNGVHQKYAHIKQSVFRLPPSIKSKKEAIIRAVERVPVPIGSIILEDVFFDFQAMEDPNIKGAAYQHGPLFYEKNYKTACKTRDGFKCRVCRSGRQLEVHHLTPKANGGTDRLVNLMTLCVTCHEKHHKQGLALPKQRRSFYIPAAHAQQGKDFLQQQLRRFAPLETTFGFITSYWRSNAGIPKSHANDAVIIANKEATPLSHYVKTRCVRSRKRSLHEARARKGRKEPNRTQERNNKNVFSMKGFHRWDSVEWEGIIGFITGFAGGHSCYVQDIDGNYIKRPGSGSRQIPFRDLRRLHGNQSRIQLILANPREDGRDQCADKP